MHADPAVAMPDDAVRAWRRDNMVRVVQEHLRAWRRGCFTTKEGHDVEERVQAILLPYTKEK